MTNLTERAQELRERLHKTVVSTFSPPMVIAHNQAEALRDLATLVCELAERLPKTVTVTASGEWHTTEMASFSQLDREISGKTEGDK